MPYLFTIPVALTLALCALLPELSPQPGSREVLALILACGACLSALLFVPVPTLRRPFMTVLINAALVTAIFVCALLVLLGSSFQWLVMMRLTVTTFLLTLTALLALRLVPTPAERNRPFFVMAFVTLIAIPVWLGPVTETAGNPAFLTNLVVAISPLSAFAVALDFDVLRTGWFYEHSALGSLRYEYLSWSSYVIVLGFLIGVITLGAGRRSNKRIEENHEQVDRV